MKNFFYTLSTNLFCKRMLLAGEDFAGERVSPVYLHNVTWPKKKHQGLSLFLKQLIFDIPILSSQQPCEGGQAECGRPKVTK